MESFLEFIVTIALVALFSLPSLLKKKKDKKAVPDVMPEEDVEMEEFEEEIIDEELEETWQQPQQQSQKGSEYFTYERMPEAGVNEKKPKGTKAKPTVQVVEDKSNEGSLLDFSDEELLKGVIYSEILKRKF